MVPPFAPRRTLPALLLALLFGAALAQPRIVVTLPPYVDLLERLAGPDAEVVGLLPAGASPHGFDPSPRLLVEIERADLVVLNGGLDAWALELVEASGGGATVVEVLELSGARPLDEERSEGNGADEDHATEDHADEDHAAEDHAAEDHAADDHAADDHADDDHAHDGVNPHVWLDPLRIRAVLPGLAEALAAADPAGAERYRANALALQADLDALHAELEATLAPVAGAAFVPVHDAWPYFAERYGLDLVVEIEPFPGREPTPRYLAEALELIRDSGAAAIFAEAQLGQRAAEVVAAEAGVALAVLDPLGGSAALRSYEALLRYNAETIANALGDGAR